VRKASTRMLEQRIQAPSPAPDLIPAETSTENLHRDWNYERGHIRSGNSASLDLLGIDSLDDSRRCIRVTSKCRVPRTSYRMVSRLWTTRMVSSLLNVPRECAMHCCSSTPVFSSSSSCRRSIATRLASLILSGNCSGLVSTSPASASHLGHRSVLFFSFPKSFAPQCDPQQPSIFHGLSGSRITSVL
jgi:hypothetical protein